MRHNKIIVKCNSRKRRTARDYHKILGQSLADAGVDKDTAYSIATKFVNNLYTKVNTKNWVLTNIMLFYETAKRELEIIKRRFQ